MKKLYIGTALLCIFFISGCTGMEPVRPLQAGDTVKIDYTCRIKNRGLVDTTFEEVASDDAIKKSRIFVKYAEYKPLTIIIGQDQPGEKPWAVKDFEPEIRERLAYALEGMSRKGTHEVKIDSAVSPLIEDHQRYFNVPRVRKVPRVRVISRAGFVRGNQREPEIGEIFSKDGMPYAEVIAADEQNVSLKLIIDETAKFETPWGKATAQEKDDTVIVTIDSEVGTLVRSGSIVGHVSKITDKFITVDYGHPFGGYPMTCQTNIVEETEKGKGTKSKKAAQ